MDKNRFTFDGHLHIPTYRIEETARTAIARGLDAIILTNYGNTSAFDYLARNRDENNNRILSSRDWDIVSLSETVLDLLSEKGVLRIIKGEEIVTKQGHLLAWGIKEAIDNGYDIEETLRRIYHQGGLAIFPHLLTRLFHGCGRKVFYEMYRRFRTEPLGVEQNGQIPNILSDNKRVKELAEEYNVVCFGNSDIHGKYREEHKNIGLRLHTSVSRIAIHPDYFIDGLRELMVDYPGIYIDIVGNTNSLLETILWNIESVRINKGKKLVDLLDGLKTAIKD
ncbi:MAG: hypothetical protein AABY07_07375 [Nanoarchaeota archaeon]